MKIIKISILPDTIRELELKLASSIRQKNTLEKEAN